MTRPRSGLGYVVMFLLAGAMTLAVLGLVGSAEPATVSVTGKAVTFWLEGQDVQVSNELTLSEHSEKHGTQARDLYILMLTGKCAASMTYCGGSTIEKLHVCVDPVTGLVGAVLQFGDEITTGFIEANAGYWERRIARENWEVCSD